MRTDAIVFGVLITLGLSISAVAQPAATPLIPLEPEKPIDAPREREAPAPEESIDQAPVEESIEEDSLNQDSLTPGSIHPDAIIPNSTAPDNPPERIDEEAPAELEENNQLEESDAPDALEPENSEPENSEPENPTSSTLPIPSNCEPLPLVGGRGSEVTKRTSPPGFSVPLPLPGPLPNPRFRSNWNTDWYIPNAHEFRRYVVVLLPHNDADYSVQMYLKYPDDTADEFYDEQDIRLTANEPLIIETEPRSDLPPYQINTNVGGILSIGVRYTIAVAGCR
jgi:hypothetical protein